MNIAMFVCLAILALFALAVMYGAFIMTLHRRRQPAGAMMNQVYSGTPTGRRQLVLPNVSQFQTPGALGVIGVDVGGLYGMPFVTLDSYQSSVAGATALFNGTYTLSVTGRIANSPLVTRQINPGDRLYLSGATYDATTNIYYGGTIDANPSTSSIPIGVLDPSYVGFVAAGATASVPVLITRDGGM